MKCEDAYDIHGVPDSVVVLVDPFFYDLDDSELVLVRAHTHTFGKFRWLRRCLLPHRGSLPHWLFFFLLLSGTLLHIGDFSADQFQSFL